MRWASAERWQRTGAFWMIRKTCLLVVCVLAASRMAWAGPETRVADAAQRKDVAAMAALLRERVDVNGPQADGTTGLHWAAHWNDLAMTRSLIAVGADPSLANRHGVTPLALACENGSAPVIEALIDAGANPEGSGTGEPPILVAARTGNVDAVKTLVAHGANVNAIEDWRGQTALMWAAADDHAAAVHALLESGSDVHARSKGGFTALLFAARQGALDAVRTLLDGGAAIDDALPSGSTPLAVAISALHYEVGAYLLSRGASVRQADKAGLVPLHVLVRARNPGATAPLRTGKGTVDSLSLLETLLAAGADPNARTAAVPNRPTNERAILIDVRLNTGGATPLLFAARGADAEVLRLLVAAGARPDIATLEGVTPLMVAAGVGYVETSDAGANTEKELLENVTLLLDLGVDINAASEHGQTALHGAVYRGIDNLIQLLASRGARLDLEDEYGRTPLLLAEQGFNNMGHYRREDQAVLLRTLYAVR
jgi:ankyrin repeat protein